MSYPSLQQRLMQQRRRTVSNSAPNQPTLSAGSLTSSGATLTGSAFSDPDVGDTQAAAQWQVTTAADTGYATPVISTGDDATHLTSYAATGLSASTAYIARVRYKDNHGNYSAYSANASFTTSATASHTFADDFAGTDGTLLQSHTPTWSGGAGVGSWTKVGTVNAIIAANRIYGDFDEAVYHSAATVAANGILRGIAFRKGTTYGSSVFELRTRRDEVADSDYELRYISGAWSLRKRVSGVFGTVAGTPADLTDSWPLGENRTAELETTSSGVIARIYATDGTTLLGTITSSDTSVSAAGYLAFHLNSTDTNGIHLDSIEFT